MSSQWYYLKGTAQHGPVASDQLKRLAEGGQLAPTDYVWKSGLSKWVLAGKVQGLFRQSEVIPVAAPASSIPEAIPVSASPVANYSPTKLSPPGLAVSISDSWKSVIARRKAAVVLLEHSNGLGTGLLVRPDGLLLTNSHVVEDAKRLLVGFSNNTNTRGIVLHKHSTKDLAIVKAAIQDCVFLDLTKECAENAEVGEEVVAIGHPQGLRFTSTRGMISVVRQRIQSEYYLQHDVAINPGNSGGPLIDMRGRLVGINTLVRAGSQGLGFAIPAAEVRAYFQQVLAGIQSGEIVVPTDDEIAEGELSISPEEALRAAIQTTGAKVSLESEGYFSLEFKNGLLLLVIPREEVVECIAPLGPLSKSANRSPRLLRRLLQLNRELGQAKFCVDDDSYLCVLGGRPLQGMDAAEAFSLIINVANAAARFHSEIEDFIDLED